MSRPVCAFLLGSVILSNTMLAGAADRASIDEVVGPWLTEKEGAVIELYDCGDGSETEICGRIVWLREPYTDDGELKKDPDNPDPSLRDRPMCGIQVVTGLKRADKNTWTHGRVYNPKDGRSYSAYLDVKEQGHLHVRVYVGIPLIGRSETWSRPQGIDIGCPES